MKLFSGKEEKEKEELIEHILLENYNQYYRLVYSYVHQDADAADIVQNGAYKAIRNSHSLQNKEYAATWVYRIMLNETFRYLKQPEHLSFEAAMENNAEEETTIKIQQQTATEDVYEDVDLHRALESLPKEDKAVVELRYFEDKKLEEIAIILEENVSTVKSRLYRSMKKLRTKLE